MLKELRVKLFAAGSGRAKILRPAFAGFLSFILCALPAFGDEHGKNDPLVRSAGGGDTGRVSDAPQILITTELGRVQVELYPDEAPKAVAALIELARSGYYATDTVMESRPGLGFAIAKMGATARAFEFTDDASNLVSRRGSVAISRSSVTSAYLNNLYFGYGHQPGLEKHYVIIGQVVDGLEQHERADPSLTYKVDGLSVVE